MAYVSRADALKLIVEENSKTILQKAATTSVAMATFKTINMGTSILNMPLVETFPTAKWLAGVDPDIAVKPSTKMSWGTKQLIAEEAATIVPIPENVIDDASFDIWGEVEERTAEALARLIDQTVFFGTTPTGDPIPASFPVGGIVGRAVAAGGHEITPGTGEDLIDGVNDAMAAVEADGYDTNIGWSGTALKAALRGLRDANGNPIYMSDYRNGAATNSIFGIPLYYVGNGAWDPAQADMIVGQRDMAVLGIRQRLTAKRLSEATVAGYNLAEQDMLALRVKMRLAFTILVPKGYGQTPTPFPFAVLRPEGYVATP